MPELHGCDVRDNYALAILKGVFSPEFVLNNLLTLRPTVVRYSVFSLFNLKLYFKRTNRTI